MLLEQYRRHCSDSDANNDLRRLFHGRIITSFVDVAWPTETAPVIRRAGLDLPDLRGM